MTRSAISNAIALGQELEAINNATADLWTWLPSYHRPESKYITPNPSITAVIQEASDYLSELRGAPGAQIGPPPMVGSQWVHHENQRIYTVLAITNEGSDRPTFPVTVVYQDSDSKVWSRPLARWGSMSPVTESE